MDDIRGYGSGHSYPVIHKMLQYECAGHSVSQSDALLTCHNHFQNQDRIGQSAHLKATTALYNPVGDATVQCPS